MCDCEKEYFLHQERAQNMIEDDRRLMRGNRLNEHGFEMPTLPSVSYDMMSDDNFMIRKLDEIIVGSEAHIHMNHLPNESNVKFKFVCSIGRFGVEPNCLLIMKRDGDGSCHTTKLSTHCGCIPNIILLEMTSRQQLWDIMLMNMMHI